MTFGVCIPALNAAETLPATLESLQNLSFFPDELVLCNNGSTDDTGLIMDGFLNQLNIPTRVIHFENSTGMASDWNRGVGELSSEWCSILPADDLVFPSWLEQHIKQIKLFENASISSVGKKLISKSGLKVPVGIAHLKSGQHKGLELKKQLLNDSRNLIGEPGAVFFRKNLFIDAGEFDPYFKYFTDLECWIRLLEKGDLVYSKSALYGFRIHGKSLTRKNLFISYKEWFEVLKKHRFDWGHHSRTKTELAVRKITILRWIVFILLSKI